MEVIECKLIIKSNNIELKEDITEEVLNKYAKEYVRDHPISNEYVTSYTYTYSSNKYLIILYKLEKCPKEKVEGYISLGLDKCIQKVKKKNKINQNVVVAIIYIIRDNASPQISFFLYHPDTGKKLDVSVCSGTKLAIRTSLFDNEKVDEELVKYFSKLNINIFDINDPFFTDICLNFSKDGKDVPLDDRIKLYFQNVSLCEDNCIYAGINLKTYEVECSCDASGSNTDIDINKILLDNPLSNEVFGFIKNSNLGVLKCFKQAFNDKFILINYGGLMMLGIFFVQIITSIIFIKCQRKNIRKYIYSLLIEINFPPKRKINIKPINLNSNRKTNYNNGNSDKNSINDNNNILNNILNQKSIEKNNIITKIKNQLTKRGLLNIKNNNEEKKEKNQYIENVSLPPFKKITETGNIKKIKSKNRNLRFKINNTNIIESGIEKSTFDSSRKKLKNTKDFGNKLFENKIKGIKINKISNIKPFLNKIKKKSLDKEFNKKKSLFTSNSDNIKNIKNIIIFEDGVKKEVKNIKIFKTKMKSNILNKIKKQHQKEERKKEKLFIYEHKEFNDKEINELDYEEAIIYDKRSFFKIFCYSLKKKQIIVNTFCSKDPLQPFSIKLLIMNFNFICYFVINGFLYNEEYVSSKLKNEENKSIYEYLGDSIERILSTSIVGGLISFIIGILFNTEKKIDDAIEKYNDNIIILKGEISKIYKYNNILINYFLILQFIGMVFFTIYIFCFCYVYPNNNIDWIESSLIVISMNQLLSIFTCLLISFFKYLSVKFQWELCFKINAYMEDKL